MIWGRKEVVRMGHAAANTSQPHGFRELRVLSIPTAHDPTTQTPAHHWDRGEALQAPSKCCFCSRLLGHLQFQGGREAQFYIVLGQEELDIGKQPSWCHTWEKGGRKIRD